MYKAFLIKYAEIAIKGKNRYIFEDALVQQIKECRGNFSGSKGDGAYFCIPPGRI